MHGLYWEKSTDGAVDYGASAAYDSNQFDPCAGLLFAVITNCFRPDAVIRFILIRVTQIA
jgi:hypothetical protein